MDGERIFELTVEIGGYRKEREKEIIAACMVEWGFRPDDFEHVRANCGRKKLLQASGLGALFDSEQIEEIVEDRARGLAGKRRQHMSR